MMSELKQFLTRSTIHLLLIEKGSNDPIGGGSGVLLKNRSKLFLATVAHNADIEESPIMYIDSGNNNDEGNRIFKKIQHNLIILSSKAPPANLKKQKAEFVSFIEKLREDKENIIQSLKEEKYSFGQLDLTIYEIPDDTLILQEEINNGITHTYKIIFETLFNDLPVVDEFYGFSGKIKGELENDVIKSKLLVIDNLKYIEECYKEWRDEHGKLYKGNYYKFELANKIENEEEYQGTSGAPVINKEGKVVGLIAFGDIGTKYIYAFPLKVFSLIIDQQN